MHHREMRALLLAVQTPLDAIANDASTDEAKARSATLGLAWKALEAHLAIGPAPETRQCPKCQKEIMRAATMCGYCWHKSEAPSAH